MNSLRLPLPSLALPAKWDGASVSQSVAVLVMSMDSPEKSDQRRNTIQHYMAEFNCPTWQLVEREISETAKETAILGDTADELKADLLVLNSEAVHRKVIDAQLLSEFVPCPILLLP